MLKTNQVAEICSCNSCIYAIHGENYGVFYFSATAALLSTIAPALFYSSSTWCRKMFASTGLISPLIANIVLNEAMDKFVHHWRKQHARGEVYIVRFADDALLSFEHKEDADALRNALEENLQLYGLELNKAKTTLLRFGRHWPPEGKEKSDSFDFLGLTHFVGKDRNGRYLVKRKTARKRMHRSLQALKVWCRKHQHKPLHWQWQKLSEKLKGHYAYYPRFSSWTLISNVR